jgi:hypothetical protein
MERSFFHPAAIPEPAAAKYCVWQWMRRRVSAASAIFYAIAKMCWPAVAFLGAFPSLPLSTNSLQGDIVLIDTLTPNNVENGESINVFIYYCGFMT